MDPDTWPLLLAVVGGPTFSGGLAGLPSLATIVTAWLASKPDPVTVIVAPRPPEPDESEMSLAPRISIASEAN